MFACGYECDSISPLNVNKVQGRELSNSYKGKTGSTLNASLKYVEAHSPRVVILECVPAVGSKRSKLIELIGKRLTATGYAVDARLLNAIDHGCPLRRQRNYIVGFRISSGQVHQ